MRPTTLTTTPSRHHSPTRFHENQSRTVPIIPNHEERRDNKTLWSMQQRSQQNRDMIFLTAYGIDEVVMDIQKSRLRILLSLLSLMPRRGVPLERSP